MSDRPDPYKLVADRARVRVKSGALGSDQVMAEGKVVAYSAQPQILVQADDGTQSWWAVTLPIEVIPPPLPPEPPRGAIVNAGGQLWHHSGGGWRPYNKPSPVRDWRYLVESYPPALGGVVRMVPEVSP